MISDKARHIIGPMRPNFLLLNPACVAVGIGTAYLATGKVSIIAACLALIGAITSHIAVNALNEYCDCISGLDFRTQKTPFSGGTGTLPKNPQMAYTALLTGIITLLITAGIGVYFALVRGLAIIPLGILGIIVIVSYTTLITYHPMICLIAPGLGFGTLMVMGTHFVLTGEYSLVSFIASLVPFFLVSDLLLLNQFPDVEADSSIGRKTLPIALGRRHSSEVYILFLFLTYLSIVIGVFLGYLPKACLLGLITAIIAVPLSIGAFRYTGDREKLLPYMGMNVVVNIVTPLLVSAGLFIGR